MDLSRCLACRNCELACAKAHAGYEDIMEALLGDAHLVSRVRVIQAAGRAVPVQCQHCEDAPCVAVCPSGALYRDEPTGRILLAPDKCIRCKACVRVCPYGAVTWDAQTKSIIRCDVCEGIIEEGEEPWCVAACPTSARRVVPVEELHEGVAAEEYDALVRDESRINRAGPHVTFTIDPELCICCGRCAKECPVECISGKKGKPPAKAKKDAEAGKKTAKVGEPFEIDQDQCIRCGTCLEVCPKDAVQRTCD